MIESDDTHSSTRDWRDGPGTAAATELIRNPASASNRRPRLDNFNVFDRFSIEKVKDPRTRKPAARMGVTKFRALLVEMHCFWPRRDKN
jgi:hypothetical protein